MKVLLVTGIWPPDVGGPATHMPEVADFLHAHGQDVSVVTTANSEPEKRPYPVHWVSRSLPPGARHVALALRIARLARRADVVYATSVPTRAAVGAALAGKPLVLKLTTDDAFERASRLGWFTGDMDAFQQASRLRLRPIRALRNAAVRHASVVVCPSTYLARLAIGWSGDPHRVVVAPNAAPDADLVPPRDEARRQLRLTGPTLVFAGRLVAQKALDVAVEALVLVPDVGLLVVGDGPDRPALEARTAALGLETRIGFLGPQPHERVLELLRAADASLLSSDWENAPHGVVESLAVGTPVIATAVGGVAELVESDVNGLLVPPRDPPALAAAIRRITQEAGLRGRLAANAASSVAEYAPGRVLARLLRILESASSGNGEACTQAAPSPPTGGRGPNVLATVLAGATRRWRSIPIGEPWRILVPLLLAQWTAACVFAFSVHHNGWLFYQGGDEIWYWTTGWLAGHGLITKTLVSPAWSFLLAPFALVFGPGFISGLPAAILIQTLILAPVALYCVYDFTARVAGRLLGYVAAALWVFGPYVSIPFFIHRYHAQYVDEFLPHAFGLTAMADYPSTVALLVAACCLLRAFQARSLEWTVAAGLTTGLAFLTKASNLIFLAAPLLLFLAGRRWRELATFLLATAPAVGALALWKYRGYGYLPAFSNSAPSTRLALGTGSIFTPLDRYGGIHWTVLHNNILALGKFFFSVRLLEFLPVGGAVAVARRAPAAALALSAWFWLFLLIKGSDPVASMNSGAFWRLLLPAVPPLLIMTSSLPLLVPVFGPTIAKRFPVAGPRAISRRTLVAAVFVLGVLPVGAAAALRPAKDDRSVLQVAQIAVPVSSAIDLRGTATQGVVRLRWNAVNGGSVRVFYKLLRHRGPLDTFCPSTQGGAARCSYWGRPISATRITTMTDRPPEAGTWTYRIAVGANWRDNPRMGDVFVVSRPVTLRFHARRLASLGAATRQRSSVDPILEHQWYLQAIHAFDYWPSALSPGPPVLVAVLDSGVDGSHPLFQGKIAAARSFVGDSPLEDNNGHGTMVAGEVLAAAGDRAAGATTVSPLQLLIGKIVSADGSIDVGAEARAIKWAVAEGARVINLSLGGSRNPTDPTLDEYSAVENAAVQYAYRSGVLVVAPTGNCTAQCPYRYASYPAALDHVLAVSAVGPDAAAPTFSNRDARRNDLAAPGVDIVSSYPLDLSKSGCEQPGYSSCAVDEGDRAGDGTSFAAPLVAAAAALLFYVKPQLTVTQAARIVELTADRVGAMSHASTTGFGILDIARALRALAGPLPAVDTEDGVIAGTSMLRFGGERDSARARLDYYDDPLDLYAIALQGGDSIVVDAQSLESGSLSVSVITPPRPDPTALHAGQITPHPAVAATDVGAIQLTLRATRPGWYTIAVAAGPDFTGVYRLTVKRTNKAA